MIAIASTYVWHGGKCYLVSTINRQSSAMDGGVYAETMVFEFDTEARKSGAIVGQMEGPQDSISAHLRAVDVVHSHGPERLA